MHLLLFPSRILISFSPLCFFSFFSCVSPLFLVSFYYFLSLSFPLPLARKLLFVGILYLPGKACRKADKNGKAMSLLEEMEVRDCFGA